VAVSEALIFLLLAGVLAPGHSKPFPPHADFHGAFFEADTNRARWVDGERTAARGGEAVRVLRVTTLPDTIFTGGAFTLKIHLALGPEVGVHPPDTLSYLRDLRSLGRVEFGGSEARGMPEREVTITYPLLALRPGLVELPPFRLGIGELEAEGGGKGEGDRLGDPGDVGPGRDMSRRVTLPLGAIFVSPVLPPDGGDLEPAPPIAPPDRKPPESGRFALLGILVSMGSAAGAWGVGRVRENRGRSPAALRAPPAMGPEEALEKLRGLVAAEPAEGREAARQFEDAFALFRIVVGGLVEGGMAHTSSEILEVIGRTDRADMALLGEILWAGDRQRFGGHPLSPEGALEAFLTLRRWVEVPHA